MQPSQHEIAFATRLRQLAPDLPPPMREYQFAAPARRWRFDFAWLDKGVAVEIDGGQFAPRGGRHNTDKDREKLNEAAARGWRVLRFSGQQVERDPAGCVDVLRRALEAA